MMGKTVSRKTGSPGLALRVEMALWSTRGSTVPVGTWRYFEEFAVTALALSLVGAVVFAGVVCCACAFTVIGPAFAPDLSGESADDCCFGGFADCAPAGGTIKVVALSSTKINMAGLVIAHLTQR